jgi:hypothetical protein
MERNLENRVGDVFTGEYGLDSGGRWPYSACDFPRPIATKKADLETPLEAHWKFKTCLVSFNQKRAIAGRRWRDGVTEIMGVIDWEIKAEMFIDPNTNEPGFTASVWPEKPVMRPAQPDEIQWNAMRTTKRGWKRLVAAIKKGPIINGKTNAWHSKYAYIYDRYPKPFWNE